MTAPLDGPSAEVAADGGVTAPTAAGLVDDGRPTATPDLAEVAPGTCPPPVLDVSAAAVGEVDDGPDGSRSPRRAHLGEAAVVALAASAWLGAWAAVEVPLVVAAFAVAAALAVRRPLALVAAVAVLASCLGDRAQPPSALAAGAVEGRATLAADPEVRHHDLVLHVRMGGRHLRVVVDPADAPGVPSMLAGEEVVLQGRARALLASEAWLRIRHIVGVVSATDVSPRGPGNLLARSTNAVRRLLVQGAHPLSPAERSLFEGLVLGDDRAQDALTRDRFRAAGLTHLLAVSGQNVTLALTLVGPALRRIPLRARLPAVGLVLLAFATLTRAEPSVLRATAMAAVAAWAANVGRPVSGVRALCLAVTAVVLVDPLLVGSLGFRLSVAASAGVILFSARIAAHLRGPAWLVDAAAVTLAAQVAVAPLLIPVAGGMPIASIPANVAASAAAGAVLVWGLTGGLMAGLLPGLAPVLHLPTRALLGWLDGVAAVADAARLGQAGVLLLCTFGALGVMAALWARSGRRRLAAAALVGLAVAAAVPGTALRLAPGGMVPIAQGAELWRADGDAVVLVLAGGTPEWELLEGLRAAGVGGIDVVVALDGRAGVARTVLLLRRRGPVGAVLAPSGHLIRDAQTPPMGVLRVDDVELDVRSTGPRLDVVVRVGRSP